MKPIHSTGLVLGICAVATFPMGCGRSSPAPAPNTGEQRPVRLALKWENVSPGLQGAALPNRSSAASPTRFESLSVEQTGIDFAHRWQPPEDYKLEIYKNLPGGGICIGDYDQDGWPDVFLTQPNVGSRLYRNLGDFKFVDATQQAGISDDDRAQGATFVDIDNDGDLDLFVCNDGRPNHLYVNNGKGKFEERAADVGLDFKGASVMAAMADFDRDGDLDVYLVTNRMEPTGEVAPPQALPDGSHAIPTESREFVDVIVPDDGRPRIIRAAQLDILYRNDDGKFTNVSEQAGIDGPYWGLAATWWDFDRDGWLDIYVANDFYSPDRLYRNNGDGTFTDVAPTALPHTPWYSMGADVADVNNDGWLDLFGSDMSGTSHYKQKASMGDMNTTGWFLTHPTPRQYMRNTLYLNTGTERFMEVAYLAGVSDSDWTWSPKFADFDEDGWTDLYITNGMNRDWTNSDLRNQSNRAASESEKMQVWLNSPQRRDENLALRNAGGLKFDDQGTAWGLAEEVVSYGAALADLDRDGDLDIIANHAEQAPGVYRNQTTGSQRVLIHLVGTGSNRWGIGATVTLTTADGKQTRHLTTAQGYMSSNEPLLHFGLGIQTRIEQLEVTWPNGTRQSFAQLPANQFYRVTEPTQSALPSREELEDAPWLTRVDIARARHRETPFNDYVRQPLLPYQHSQLGPGLACGDIDGDGDDDLFLSGASGQSGQLLENREGAFVPKDDGQPWNDDSSQEDMAPLFFDADGDGDLDLYVVSGGVECEPNASTLQDRLYLNDGTGDFAHAPQDTLPDMPHSGSVAAAADFDRDGDLDLFVGGRVIPGEYPKTPVSQLLVNENGTFREAAGTLAPGLGRVGLVTSALWSDVDGDGWTDLLVTLEWGAVRLFRNHRGELVDETSLAGFDSQSGWYNSITAGDFDRDGDVDYLVGNCGLNTKYHASATKPTYLYYGDFEDNGCHRLVEAEFEGGTLFTVRGKSCSTNAMPFLGDKFTKFHDFATASLQEIYTESSLKNAIRLEATSLESGVWRNVGNGRFEFIALPRLAQAAPVFGCVIDDVNGDGNVDIVAAQNFFGLQRETGRADGGVGMVLAGNGDCTFTPVWPNQSGFVVADDATAACLMQTSGSEPPLILVASNDGPLHAFRSVSSDDRRIAVRLKGPAGNRQAIGAKIVASYQDGRRQLAEISAGGGYLSQSSAAARFSAKGLQRILVVWPDDEQSTIAEFAGDLVELTHPASS